MSNVGPGMRACWSISALLLAAELAAGCASQQRCPQPACPPGPIALGCQPVQRQPLVADVSLVSRTEALPGRAYCNMPEREAQCLAAANSSLGRLLEQEADALAAQATGHHQPGGIHATQQILWLQAAHERNRAAAAALELLLRIAEAESGADNLRRRLEQIESNLGDVHRLQAAGLEAPVSPPEIEAQQLELEHKLVEVELTIDQLNHKLVSLLGGEPPPATRLWPEVDLHVDPAVPALEETQMVAISQRADLAAVRLAAVGGGALATSRAMLGQTHAGLGLAMSAHSL
jgi:hypothetical protein